MDDSDRDDLPMNSPAVGPAVTPVSNTDERNYDSLLEAQKDLGAAIRGLYKDFNAFDVYKEDTTEDAKNKLLRTIDGKQVAYDILLPIKAKLDQTIENIKKKNEERQ